MEFLKELSKIIRDNNYKGKSLLIMAHKYSCSDGHIYPVGIYKSVESACRCMSRVMNERCGRYGVFVYVSLPNEPTNDDDKRLKLIYEVESVYKHKLKSYSQTREKQVKQIKQSK